MIVAIGGENRRALALGRRFGRHVSISWTRMNPSTLLLACEDPRDVDRFSTALPSLTDHNGCRIVLLHVIEKIFPVATLAALGGGLILPPPPIEAERRWLQTHTEEARQQLAQLRAQLPTRMPVCLRVEQGPPAESICWVADEEQASLIVLVGHRRGRLRRWLLGRTAREVIDAAPCPVVVVGPGADPRRPGMRRAAGVFPAGSRVAPPVDRPLMAPPFRA